MRGNGEGKKGEWHQDIKNGENGKGGGERQDTVGARGIIKYKKKGKRERRRRERVTKIPRSQKGGGIWGLFRGQGSVYRDGI